MPKIGIRQLKNETSAVIQAVREEGVEYIITFRGDPVAVIKPFENSADSPLAEGQITHEELRARLDKLAAELSARWKSEESAIDLISEQRR
ncbi:MAG: type II toxin-antitoxin system Phd/YefM family antitoxin [Candidatus Promineifilaceae bacterium]|jgi:prevent-host-death family protein